MVLRESVRAILLTPRSEILLMRIHPPDEDDYFWITPGGGKENGETIDAALKRELLEETGLQQGFSIGPLVWRRQHTFNWGGKRLCQQEQYFIVLTDRFAPVMSDAVEAAVLDRFRWWPLAELRSTTEPFAPLSLADIVTRYLRVGPPTEAPDVEILED